MPVTSREDLTKTDEAQATPPTDHEARYGDERTQADTRRNLLVALGVFAALGLVLAAILIAFSSGPEKGSSAASPSSAPSTAAPAAPAPAAGTVNASLQEFSITPSSTSAKAGPVTFAVRNAGQVPHELVVIRTTKPAGSLLGPGGRADETGNVGETGELAPGASKSVRLKLTPGHYAVICNLPGHYSAGQHVDFTVQ